jgi:hypothetical protein
MPLPREKSVEMIWPELVHRFLTPCTSVTFYAHLFLGVVIFGGFGVYFAIYKSHWSVEETSAALLSYFAALAGAALLEFDSENQPYLRSFGLIAFGIFIIVFALVVLTEHWFQLFWSLTGTVLGILFWWVANGLNERFNDVKPQSALGGDPSSSLQESDEEGWLK